MHFTKPIPPPSSPTRPLQLLQNIGSHLHSYWLYYSIDATARVLQYVITFHKIYLQDIKQIGIAPCNLYTCPKLLHPVQPYVYTYTINFAKYFYCTSCYCALRYVWHHIAWSLYLWNCLCCVFLEIWDWVKVYCVIDVV